MYHPQNRSPAQAIPGPANDKPEDEDGMSPQRKKPVCTKCNEPMAGHRRPNRGAPLCPRDDADRVFVDLSRSRTPTPTRSSAPRNHPYPSPQTSPIRRSSADLTFNPGERWRYQNPNWVDRDAPQSVAVPSRGSSSSWVSTELDPEAAAIAPSSRSSRWPAYASRHNAIEEEGAEAAGAEDGEEEEEEGEGEEADDGASDTSSTLLRVTSNLLLANPVSRGLSRVLSTSLPLASVLRTPREDLARVRAAAVQRGLHAEVVHAPARVKEEPREGRLGAQSSWCVVLGRDKELVQNLVEAQQPPAPYDFDRGLRVERNEKVGTYPLDPRSLRLSYLDIVVAGAVGGTVVVFLLSYL